MADPLIPKTAGQLAADLTTAPAQTATLLNSNELFERVRRALKSMGAETHDIESYISNLEDVLLGDESTNKSLKATFNSLSEKAKGELSLAMNTTEPVVSDTAVGELVKAIQDPKHIDRVTASIEHAASNAPASLEAVVARAEKRLPGLTAADREVLMREIKATEIPGTGKYKYTNKNLIDFEEAYQRKTSRERLKQVAREAKTSGAPQVAEVTQPSSVELHIKSLEAKNPEMASLLKDAIKKAEAGGAPIDLDAVKKLQRIAAGGKGFTLKEQGDLIEQARAAVAAPTSYTDVLPEGAPFERFTRAGVKQPRLPIPRDKALARVIVNPEALAVSNNIEEAGIYHTLKDMAAAEKSATAAYSPNVAGMLQETLGAAPPSTPAQALLEAALPSPGNNPWRRGARRLRRAAVRDAQMVSPKALGTLEAAKAADPVAALSAAAYDGPRFSLPPVVEGEAAASAARALLPEGIGALRSVAGIAPEAPSLLRRVAAGVGAVAAAHPILSTAAFIGADIAAASEIGDWTAPAVESAQFDTQLRARDAQALNQLPIDVALRAAAAKNYVSPWEQAMEGRQTVQQMQQQAAARDTHRNAMGLAPGDSIL